MAWTHESIGKLRKYHDDGLSYQQIADKLGKSKNAVSGKAHRLNLPERPSPIIRPANGAQMPTNQGAHQAKTKPKSAKASSKRPETASMPAAAPYTQATVSPPDTPPETNAESEAVTTRTSVYPERKAGTCCWPLGEPGTPEFHFCSSEAIKGKPYCPVHHAIAYVKVRDRRDDAA